MATKLDQSLKNAIAIFKDNESKKCTVNSLEKCKGAIRELSGNQNTDFDSIAFELDKAIKCIETSYEAVKKSLPLVNKNVNKWIKSCDRLS